MGSKVADRFGAKPVVAACFALGALAILLLTAGFPLGMLLPVVAVVGLGTSGTQTLIHGLVANFYRTNVRAGGMAWCAGFGRLGGVGGPILGGYLAGGGFALDTILYSGQRGRGGQRPDHPRTVIQEQPGVCPRTADRSPKER